MVQRNINIATHNEMHYIHGQPKSTAHDTLQPEEVEGQSYE
jgi:hypothetical protein